MAEKNSSDLHKYEYVLYRYYNNSESNRGLPSELVSASTPERSHISEKWNESLTSADVQHSTSVKLEVDSDSSSAQLKMIHEPVENAQFRAFNMTISDFVSPYDVDTQAKPLKEMPERQFISGNIENSELDSIGITKRPHCSSAGLEDHLATEVSDDWLRAHAVGTKDSNEYIIKNEPKNEPLYTNAADQITVQSCDVDAHRITEMFCAEIKSESLIENNSLVDAKTEVNVLETYNVMQSSDVDAELLHAEIKSESLIENNTLVDTKTEANFLETYTVRQSSDVDANGITELLHAEIKSESLIENNSLVDAKTEANCLETYTVMQSSDVDANGITELLHAEIKSESLIENNSLVDTKTEANCLETYTVMQSSDVDAELLHAEIKSESLIENNSLVDAKTEAQFLETYAVMQSSDVDTNRITELLRAEIKSESLIENNSLVDAETEANCLETDAVMQSSDVDASCVTEQLHAEINSESLIESNFLADAKTEANILETDAVIPNKGVSNVTEATMKTGGLLLLENKLEGETTEASEKDSFFIGDVEITQSDWDKFNRQLHAQILGNQNKDNLLQSVEGKTNNFCFMCKRVFKDLQSHMRIHRQKCHMCNRIFRHQTNLKTHLKSHDVNSFVRQQPNTCEICLITFHSKSTFKRHLQQHIIYPYMCKLCRKFCKNVDEFTEHTFRCQKERPHVCQLCNKGFFYKKTLSGHAINCHSAGTVNTCLICGKIFQTKYNLKKHILRHVNPKSYQCPHCSDVYYREDVYKVHLTEHSGSKAYICCSLCNKVLRSSNLSRHMSLCHTKKCCICKSVFKDRGSLRKHMRKHNIPVDVKCEICMKHFKSELTYRVHKRGHHTDAFRCHICHRRLYAHLQLHHHFHAKHKENFPLTCCFCKKEFQNVTKLSCQICRRIFSRKVKLLKTHKPKRKVTCEICNKTFDVDRLLCHKVTEHLRKPFRCEFCNEQFKHLNNLKVHRCCIHKKRKSKKQEDSDVQTRLSASELTKSTTKHEHDEESDSIIEESVIMSQESGVRTEKLVSSTEKSASRNKEPARRLQVLPVPKVSESDQSFSERRDCKEKCGQKDKMNMSLKEASAEKILMDLCAPVRQNDQVQKTEVKINAQVGKNEELPFACKSCDKRFRYLLQLKQHMKQKKRSIRQLKSFVKC